MNFESLEQSVRYAFSSEGRTNGKLTCTLKNAIRDATVSALAQVGQALSSLQDDTLSDVILIQKQDIKSV